MDMNVDANELIGRLSTRIAQQVQTIEIQQLQIEKFQSALAELTPKAESSNGDS